MLEAIGLTKQYGELTAVDNLNLRVGEGETFCLLGATGAGKTTIINLFLNFTEPTSGKALIDGEEVAADPRAARRNAACLPGNVMLYGNFTARQNLDYFARLGERDGLGKVDYYECLARVGLPESAFEMRVRNFTRGMRQKVGLAIALVKDARNLLLDEPTAGLEPGEAAEFARLLHGLRDEGKAVLACTSDIFRAREFADRIGILQKGRLRMIRSRAEFRTEDPSRIGLTYMQEAV